MHTGLSNGPKPILPHLSEKELYSPTSAYLNICDHFTPFFPLSLLRIFYPDKYHSPLSVLFPLYSFSFSQLFSLRFFRFLTPIRSADTPPPPGAVCKRSVFIGRIIGYCHQSRASLYPIFIGILFKQCFEHAGSRILAVAAALACCVADPALRLHKVNVGRK
jgi:hypothetical protein